MHLICCSEEEHNGEYHCQYVMECMDKPLSVMLQEDWHHPQLIGAVDVMLQVAEGMKYLHSLRFAHRDLKPDNILMKSLVAETYAAESSKSSNLTLGADPPPATNNQAFWIAKICDFGISKVKMESTAYANQTQNIGTLMYRAPEVHELQLNAEPPERSQLMKTDVYSFGIICSQLLTGRSCPFDHSLLYDDTKEFKNAVRDHNRRPELPQVCPIHLSTLIQRCWHGNPLV
jgi:serine/threonine protein kinase